MPEGDTIHKLARAIAPRLEGRRLARATVQGARESALEGRAVTQVEARGKHMLVHVEGDLILRSHLGMHGSWHRYAPGETWRRPARQASIVLATDADVFVCFRAKETEWLRAGGARERDLRRRIGPDLTADVAPDLVDLVRHVQKRVPADTPLVDLLLDQSAASGIGNVYKSELLFLERWHPLETLASVSAVALERLYMRARSLLRSNLRGGARVTRTAGDGAGDLWVYGRSGRRCLKCGVALESAALGRDQRITTWCPRCQARRARAGPISPGAPGAPDVSGGSGPSGT